jgi:hypothetical protein
MLTWGLLWQPKRQRLVDEGWVAGELTRYTIVFC